MLSENIDRRVLCGLRFVDPSTGRVIERPLKLSAGEARFIRNSSYIYIIASAPGFEAHSRAFHEPPDVPELESESLEMNVEDPSGRFLPRTLTVKLPRNADGEKKNDDNSLFRPLDIPMYSASTATIRANWSIIRATLVSKNGDNDEEPAQGALLRVVRNSDNQIMARSLTDKRGEALVVVPGVPITTFAEGEGQDSGNGGDNTEPVLAFEIAAKLQVIFDPESSWPVDPDRLEAEEESLLRDTVDVLLRTGRMEKVSRILRININQPN